MDTAAVSPAIGSLLEIAVKNVVIRQRSALAGGFHHGIEPILAVFLRRERRLL
jgi:hypothetical protein